MKYIGIILMLFATLINATQTEEINVMLDKVKRAPNRYEKDKFDRLPRKSELDTSQQELLQDLQEMESYYLHELDSFDRHHKGDPIQSRLKTHTIKIKSKPEIVTFDDAIQFSSAKNNKRFEIREDDELLQGFSKSTEYAKDANHGVISITNKAQQAVNDLEESFTCNEAAEPQYMEEVLDLHVDAFYQPGQSKVVGFGFSLNTIQEQQVFEYDLVRGVQVKYPHIGDKGLQSVVGSISNWRENKNFILELQEFRGTNHVTKNFLNMIRSSLQMPARANNYVFKIPNTRYPYQTSHGFWKDNFTLRWKASIPPKKWRDEGKWISSNPQLQEWEQLGVCEVIESMPTIGHEIRNINGYAIDEPCWQKRVRYACAAISEKNECECYKNPSCYQVGSECIAKIGPFCTEYKQTFKCKRHVKSNLRFDGVNIQYGDGELLIGESFEATEFANAAGHLNLLNEMKHNMLADGDNVRIFAGQPQSCDIVLGSAIQNCCNFKGVLKDVIGGGCKSAETLANAVVKDNRCHLVGGKYCVSKVAGICVKQRKTYCCFASKLAKIFQEIAHLQLGISWGEGKSPNCAPLNPEDFAKLDFDAANARHLLQQVINDAFAIAGTTAEAAEQKLALHTNLVDRLQAMQDGVIAHQQEQLAIAKEGR